MCGEKKGEGGKGEGAASQWPLFKMSSGVGRGGGKGEENGRVAISQLLFPSSREGKKSYLEEISVHLREGNECVAAP